MSYVSLSSAPLNSILPPLGVVSVGVEAKKTFILGG